MMLEAIMRDVRHALRGLSKNPGYALVFVVTLGLGIGANTAMFSAVNGVLLRPLPHEDGDRLVYLRHSARLAGLENRIGLEIESLSGPNQSRGFVQQPVPARCVEIHTSTHTRTCCQGGPALSA